MCHTSPIVRAGGQVLEGDRFFLRRSLLLGPAGGGGAGVFTKLSESLQPLLPHNNRVSVGVTVRGWPACAFGVRVQEVQSLQQGDPVPRVVT